MTTAGTRQEHDHDEARYDAGDEQLAYREAGDAADDDEGGTWRNQRAQPASSKERPQAEASIVALTVEFGHRHLADHDDGGRARAQGRREYALADDPCRDKTAPYPARASWRPP